MGVNKLQELSDKIFMASLLLMIVSMLVSGIALPSVLVRRKTVEDEESELTKTQKRYKKQDVALQRLAKSKMLWISILGMIVSIILSYL